jgi:hypothetical protein
MFFFGEVRFSIHERGRKIWRREEAVWDYVSILHLFVLTVDLRTLTGGARVAGNFWARGPGNRKESWG